VKWRAFFETAMALVDIVETSYRPSEAFRALV
jgi:hypothetical protein